MLIYPCNHSNLTNYPASDHLSVDFWPSCPFSCERLTLCLTLTEYVSRQELSAWNWHHQQPVHGSNFGGLAVERHQRFRTNSPIALMRNLLAVSSVQSTCQAEFWGRMNCYTGNLWLQKDVGSFEWRNAMCLWDRKTIFVHNFSSCQYFIASNFTVSL